MHVDSTHAMQTLRMHVDIARMHVLHVDTANMHAGTAAHLALSCISIGQTTTGINRLSEYNCNIYFRGTPSELSLHVLHWRWPSDNVLVQMYIQAYTHRGHFYYTEHHVM
jgi:hypothetical protein